MIPVKHVDVKKGVQECIKRLTEEEKEEMYKLNQWLKTEDDKEFEKFLFGHRIDLNVNNKGDVVVAIAPVEENE